MTVLNAIAIDGHTLQIGSQRLTLWGVDAPDIGQSCMVDYHEYPCGKMARKALEIAVANGKLTCGVMGQDAMGNNLAKCSIDKDDVAQLMVRTGWAVDNSDTSRGFYKPDQDLARQKKSGLWQGKFALPAKWRAGDQSLDMPESSP